MKHDQKRVDKARVRRARRADKPEATEYARANLHGKMRPKRDQ